MTYALSGGQHLRIHDVPSEYVTPLPPFPKIQDTPTESALHVRCHNVCNDVCCKYANACRPQKLLNVVLKFLNSVTPPHKRLNVVLEFLNSVTPPHKLLNVALKFLNSVTPPHRILLNMVLKFLSNRSGSVSSLQQCVIVLCVVLCHAPLARSTNISPLRIFTV